MGKIKRTKNILRLSNKRSYNVPKAASRDRTPRTSQNLAGNDPVSGWSTTNPNTRMTRSIKKEIITLGRHDGYVRSSKYLYKLQLQCPENNRRNQVYDGEKRIFMSVKKFRVNNIIKASIPTIIENLTNSCNVKTKTGDSPVNTGDGTSLDGIDDVSLNNVKNVTSDKIDDMTPNKREDVTSDITDAVTPDNTDDEKYTKLPLNLALCNIFTYSFVRRINSELAEICSDKFDNKYNKIASQKGKNRELIPQHLTEDTIIRELCNHRNFRIKPLTYIVNLLELGREAPPTTVQGMDWVSFKDERLRIRSFLNYPTRANKSALVLAADGFVYIGTGMNRDDSVICFSCCVKIRDWQPSDVVSDVHGMRSPNCSMVTKINCENIPLHSNLDFNYVLNSLNHRSDNFESPIKVSSQNNVLETDSASDSKSPHLPQQSADIETDCTYESKRPYLPQQITKPSQHIGESLVRTPISNERISNQPSEAFGFASLPVSPVISPIPGAQVAQKSNSAGNSSQLSHPTTTSKISQTPSTTKQPLAPNVPSNTTRNSTQSVPQALTASTNSAVISTEDTTTSTSQNIPAAPTVMPSTNSAGGTVTATTAGGQKDNRNGKGPTYAELGIMTERPKRPEYALKAKRFETFNNWPSHHHLKPEDLSAAGFYYAGYGDCARCFFCGGGLRNWEDEDDVWVEHARWFPKCAYIRQLMGPVFVEKVQELNKTRDQISYALVIESMGTSGTTFKPDTKENPWKKDPAVKTVLELGFYPEKDVLEIAESLKNGGTEKPKPFISLTFSLDNILYILSTGKSVYDDSRQLASFLSADVILQRLQDKPRLETKTTKSNSVSNIVTTAQDEEAIREIKERNNQLRQQTVCKICMDKEVAVVFLPCGHLVSCSECGAAMKDCPVCRVNIKGVVRAFMS